MTEAEMIEREVDERLASELEARRAAIRLEVADRMRREAFRKRMDHINRRRPEIDDPPSPEVQAVLDAQNAASRKADQERRAANEKRWAEQEKARLEAERKLPRMRVPGNVNDEGFAIKR